MTVWDDRILEYLSETESGSASVGDLADSGVILVSNSHVSRRCQKMAERGFVLDIGNGVYGITEEGKAYLDGEYDAEKGIYIEVTDGENSDTVPEPDGP